MKIVVYEQDLLIRDDITETLEDAFGAKVFSFDQLEKLCEGTFDKGTLVVLSLTRQEVEEYLVQTLNALPDTDVILIAGNVSKDAENKVAGYISKPFSSTDVTETVKGVFSDLR